MNLKKLNAPHVYTGKDGRVVRVWRCSVCGQNFEWGSTSKWFGSELDRDNEAWDRILVTCGRRCFERAHKEPACIALLKLGTKE